VSRAVPSRFYATLYISTPTYRPFLLRSDDDGGTWVSNELTGQLGAVALRLIGVDVDNPDVVYLRLIAQNGVESLGIATDGGGAATAVLQLQAGQLMSGFLKRSADGALLVAQQPGPSAFVSTDQGASFQPFLPDRHINAFAERDGGLFVATNNRYETFAVGAVDGDGGIAALLVYSGICDLVQCGNIPAACATWWQSQQGILSIPPTVCGRIPPDAGFRDAGVPDAGIAKHSSCGCSGAGAPALALVLAFLAATALQRRSAEAKRSARATDEIAASRRPARPRAHGTDG
jgi:hypothetical protein